MFLNLLITSISAVATVMGIADEIHPSMAVWSANDSLPLVSTRFSSVTSSAVFSANDFFFTYINTEFRPKIVRVIVSETWTSEEVSNAYISDDPEFKVIDAEEYLFSIGVDELGYVHVAGNMNDWPTPANHQHLPESFRTAHCLLWASTNLGQLEQIHFVGNDPDACPPTGGGYKWFRYYNDQSGNLFAMWRSIPGPDGQRALSMARYLVGVGGSSGHGWATLGKPPQGSTTPCLAVSTADQGEGQEPAEWDSDVSFTRDGQVEIGTLIFGERGRGYDYTAAIWAVYDNSSNTRNPEDFFRLDGGRIDMPMTAYTDTNSDAEIAYKTEGRSLEPYVGVTDLGGRPLLVVADTDVNEGRLTVFESANNHFRKLDVDVGWNGPFTAMADRVGHVTVLTDNALFRLDKDTHRSYGHGHTWKSLVVDKAYHRRTSRVVGLSLQEQPNGEPGEVSLVVMGPSVPTIPGMPTEPLPSRPPTATSPEPEAGMGAGAVAGIVIGAAAGVAAVAAGGVAVARARAAAPVKVAKPAAEAFETMHADQRTSRELGQQVSDEAFF